MGDPKENTRLTFWSCLKIEQGLNVTKSTDDVSLQIQHLDQLTLSVQKLQKFLTDSISFLRPYTIQTAQETINQLKEAIDERRAIFAPKKKFAFKGLTIHFLFKKSCIISMQFLQVPYHSLYIFKFC